MQPTSESQRLVHLDVLRGFALFGILLVNFEWFTRPAQAMLLGADPGLTGVHQVVDWGIHWLAEGKFYPLFALLFGAGFALMATQARTRERSIWGPYLRRLLVLAAFGGAHIALLWWGDILLTYALSALLMVLLFRNTPVQRLWKWSLGLILVPLVFVWLTGLAHLDPDFAAEMQADTEIYRAELVEVIERAEAIHVHATFSENVGQRLRDYAAFLDLFVLSMILGFFMLGRWFIASGILTQPAAHLRFLRRWRVLGLIVGLGLAAGATALLYPLETLNLTPRMSAGYTLSIVAGLVLSLGYLATVILAADKLRWLAPAGRMALTNYLLQSLFWTSVFYGYGLGLWGQIPRAWHPLLVVVFFALQVAGSHWWLRRFRFGPAEWLWRSLTYWKIQPLRVATV